VTKESGAAIIRVTEGGEASLSCDEEQPFSPRWVRRTDAGVPKVELPAESIEKGVNPGCISDPGDKAFKNCPSSVSRVNLGLGVFSLRQGVQKAGAPTELEEPCGVSLLVGVSGAALLAS